MSMLKRMVATILGSLALAILPAHGQGTFPGIGDDMTSSLGSFKIQVANQFAPLFASCPPTLYDPSSRVFSSPTLSDQGTIIGRSNVTLDDSPFRKGSVPAGSTRTVVPEDTLIQPPGYPCFGSTSCASGPGTRVVHTEIHSLMMTALSSPLITVRAGTHYDDSPFQADPPFRPSVGLVQSQSGPSNNPAVDFPASSFFDVYAKVDLPAGTCGGFPAVTLYNSMPLIVTNNQLTQFPPKVVYLHDASTIVPILFEYDGPPGGPSGAPLWHKNDKLGCFVLAGHGVGFSSNSQTDMNNFTQYMGGQPNSPCPL